MKDILRGLRVMGKFIILVNLVFLIFACHNNVDLNVEDYKSLITSFERVYSENKLDSCHYYLDLGKETALNKKGHEEWAMRLLVNEGRTYAKAGEYALAGESYAAAKKIAYEINHYDVANIIYYEFRLDIEKGLEIVDDSYYDEAIEYFSKIDGHEALAYIYSLRYWINQHLNDLEKAHEDLNKAAEHGLAGEVYERLFIVYGLLASNAFAANNFLIAKEEYEKKLEAARKLEDVEKVEHAKFDLAAVNHVMGNYPEALSYYFKMINYFETKVELNILPSLYNNIGSCFLEIEKYNQALIYFEKASAKNLETSNPTLDELNLRKIFYYNQSVALGQLGRHNESLEVLEKSQELAIEQEDCDYQQIINYAKGFAYLKLDKLNKARSIFEFKDEVTEDCSSEGNEISRVSLEHGLFLLNIGMYNKAEKACNDALEKATKANHLSAIKQCVKCLLDIAVEQKNYEKAFQYREEYTELRDSILNLQFLSNLQFQELKYVKEKNELEAAVQYAELETESAVQLNKSRRRTLWFIFLTILGLLSALSFSMLFRKEKRHKKDIKARNKKLAFANNALNEANEELEENKVKLKSQLTNKILLISGYVQIMDNFKEEISSSPKIDSHSKSKLLHKLNDRTHIESVIEELELESYELNKAFNARLYAQYPNLSKNDLKLINYRRLNMSNKEIAMFLNKRPEAVKVAITRLRKKLGITDSSYSLNAFIIEFELQKD